MESSLEMNISFQSSKPVVTVLKLTCYFKQHELFLQGPNHNEIVNN